MTLPDLKTYYEAIIIKTAWCLWKDRHKDQRDKIEVDPNTHLNSEAKAVLWTKDSLSTKSGGTIRFLMQEKCLDTDIILLKST